MERKLNSMSKKVKKLSIKSKKWSPIFNSRKNNKRIKN